MANISAIKLPDGVTYDIVDRVSKDIFIAEYGVTTYDEIDDAFINGKAIILKWQSSGYDRYFPCSIIDTSSSYKLTFLMSKSIAYDVEVKPLTPPLDWSYSSRNLQETLVSGTNIKTINSESLLGSGNIDTKDVFVAEYGVTSYNDVYNAHVAHKQIILKYPSPNDYFYIPCSTFCSGAGSSINLWFLFAWSVSDSVATCVELTSSNNWSANSAALQGRLVSGTNIKTINGNSILGSGNMDIAAGVSDVQSDGVSVVTNGVANIDTFGKSTSSTAGKKGLVPAPYASEYLEQVFLTATGYWATESFSKEIANSTQRLKRQIKVNDAVEHNWRITFDNATTSVSGFMSPSDKTKLDGIASGAEMNVQSDWNEADSTADDYIKNKPTIPSKTSDLNNDVPFATTATATTSTNGLMSSTDKSKLDGIESGAEVNYVTKITQHFIADPNDSQYVYPRSATLDYNAVGINDVELLTKTALGKFNGVCDLDASSKVPKSRLPSTSVPTADEVAEFDSDAQMNSTDMSSQDVDDFIDDLSVVGSLIDLFYPVGSYYETSDVTFNPNTEWGGTWELETEGQVHIGAGTNYTIDGALTNTTDGGEQNHQLTSTESYYPARISTSFTISSTPVPQSGTTRYAPTIKEANKWTKYDTHTASAHNNMQPYIVVNRWHRTA